MFEVQGRADANRGNAKKQARDVPHCCWQAVTHFDYTEFGVKHYGTPVATSNGWLDDKGIAGLTAAQRQAALDLFNARKDKPQQLKWLTGPAPVFTAAQAAK